MNACTIVSCFANGVGLEHCSRVPTRPYFEDRISCAELLVAAAFAIPSLGGSAATDAYTARYRIVEARAQVKVELLEEAAMLAGRVFQEMHRQAAATRLVLFLKAVSEETPGG